MARVLSALGRRNVAETVELWQAVERIYREVWVGGDRSAQMKVYTISVETLSDLACGL
jgi:hypothetical protein